MYIPLPPHTTLSLPPTPDVILVCYLHNTVPEGRHMLSQEACCLPGAIWEATKTLLRLVQPLHQYCTSSSNQYHLH